MKIRQRCYRCFRPRALCYCETIPRINNRTHVLILQHVAERPHPFNTARMVEQALGNCDVIARCNRRMGELDLQISRGAALLYPEASAPRLDQLPPDQRPEQLIIIDGTWHQAKTIVRDVLQLASLPRIRLNPASPGRYRIRREPNANSLSTLEATVMALKSLEPETTGLDQLLAAFETMIDVQLQNSAGHNAWRRKKTRQSTRRFMPRALTDPAAGLVVAYGERAPRAIDGEPRNPLPVNWFARRLGTSQEFSATIQQRQPPCSSDLRHMGLTATDFETAISPEEFRRRWANFLSPRDILVVYHQRTAQLLTNIGAELPRCLVLKSIYRSRGADFRSLGELIALQGIDIPQSELGCRAQQRTMMAAAAVQHLRDEAGRRTPGVRKPLLPASLPGGRCG